MNRSRLLKLLQKMYQISLNEISQVNVIAVQLGRLIVCYFNIKFLAQKNTLRQCIKNNGDHMI